MKHHWTKQQEEELKTDYLVLTKEQLIEKYKKDITAIQSKAKKMGIKGRAKNLFDQNKITGKRKITLETETQICEEYNSEENLSSIQLGNKYNLSKTHILRILKKYNIPRRDIRESHRTYPINQDFFDTWSVESAYLVGWIFSDGNIQNSEREEISIGLAEEDKGHLQFLNNLLQPEKPLSFYSKEKDRALGKNCQDVWRMSIQCKKIIDKFYYEFKCLERKSLILEFPTFIPNEFMPAFLAGYCGGDSGLSVTVSPTRKDKLGNPKVEFDLGIVGSRPFCEQLKLFINNRLNLNCCLTKDKRTPELRICYLGGVQTIHKFLLWLDKHCPYMLERKRKTWEYMMDFFNNKPRMKQMSNKIYKDGVYKNGKLIWSPP